MRTIIGNLIPLPQALLCRRGLRDTDLALGGPLLTRPSEEDVSRAREKRKD